MIIYDMVGSFTSGTTWDDFFSNSEYYPHVTIKQSDYDGESNIDERNHPEDWYDVTVKVFNKLSCTRALANICGVQITDIIINELNVATSV